MDVHKIRYTIKLFRKSKTFPNFFVQIAPVSSFSREYVLKTLFIKHGAKQKLTQYEICESTMFQTKTVFGIFPVI
jgi:hypothetical protein